MSQEVCMLCKVVLLCKATFEFVPGAKFIASGQSIDDKERTQTNSFCLMASVERISKGLKAACAEVCLIRVQAKSLL